MPTLLARIGLTIIAIGSTIAARPAHASKTVHVYSVFWSSDTTDLHTVETFFGCLTGSSSFGGAWANEWGVGPVVYHGATVLQAAPPDPLQLDGSLSTALQAAFASGALPSPSAGYSSIYMVHGPSNVTVLAANGTQLCTDAAQACGVHDLNTYNGVDYQVGLVPLSCARCGGTLQSATWIGEHELGEALGWEGTGGFENGDGCESNSNLTTLACCGQSYVIQQMAKPAGMYVCETILATGAMCTCGVAQTACASAKSCCGGLACQPWVAQAGDTPKNVCCDEKEQACGGTNDCCGGLTCQAGRCTCQPAGAFCLRDVDCCGDGFCVAGKCGASALSAQLGGNDAVSAVGWPDGRTELFAQRTDGSVVHALSGPGGFIAGALDGGASILGGGASCGAAALFWLPNLANDDYPELFTPRPDGTTQHAYFDHGAWTGFTPLGGAGLSHLSTLAWPDGHSELFSLGSDGAVWHDFWDPGKAAWSGWASMGGRFATGAAPLVWGDGHAELFATDGNGGAWHNYSGKFTGGWSGWQKLDGQLASRPIPVRWPDGHVELFARGTDGQLTHSSWSKSWPAFAALGAGTTLLGEPGVVVVVEGPLVFARRSDGQLVELRWDGKAWSGFSSVPAPLLASDPFGWARADGSVDLFAVDLAGNLQHAVRAKGGGFGGFMALGGEIAPCAGEPTPLPDGGVAIADGAGASGGDETGAEGGSQDGAAKGGGCALAGRDAPRPWSASALYLLAVVALVRAVRMRLRPLRE